MVLYLIAPSYLLIFIAFLSMLTGSILFLDEGGSLRLEYFVKHLLEGVKNYVNDESDFR